MIDYPAGFTAASIPFTTQDNNGAPVAPSTAFETADIQLYRNGSNTPRSSQSGWTIQSPLNSVVGLHRLVIDLSDNTDSGFYAAGRVYTAVLSPSDETVNGQVVVKVLGQFSIDLYGVATAITNVAAVKAKTDSLTFTGAGKVDASVRDWLGTAPNALQSGRVDSYLGAVASAVIAAASFASGAFDAVWGVATRVLTAATNITSTGGTTVPQTGDAYGRLGAPAGASVSADIAAVGSLATAIAGYVDTEVAAIKTVTDGIAAGTQKVTPIDVDGITFASMMELMTAVLSGKAAVTDNGDGTRTVAFKKRDGTTTKATITLSTPYGTRTGSVINS